VAWRWRAASRGDGESGEEITAKCAATIQSVPLPPAAWNDPPEWLEVRGEALIPDSNLRGHQAPERASPATGAAVCPTRAMPAAAPASARIRPWWRQRRLGSFLQPLHPAGDWQPAAGEPSGPAASGSCLSWLAARRLPGSTQRRALCPRSWRRWRPSSRNGNKQRHQLAYATDGVVG